jgi:hypothetical protein
MHEIYNTNKTIIHILNLINLNAVFKGLETIDIIDYL